MDSGAFVQLGEELMLRAQVKHGDGKVFADAAIGRVSNILDRYSKFFDIFELLQNMSNFSVQDVYISVQ